MSTATIGELEPDMRRAKDEGMRTATIEELVYEMKMAKEKGRPAPIFFIGAGASETGGIPLAGEIIKEIIRTYSGNPRIDGLSKDDRTYPKLMECLNAEDRNSLLREYIDKAKINVTHIYLAHLMKKGYADYVLTVNFDNLMLRALALFNEFPATYDMAILSDLTTTTFKEKSVVYLHGQHHGLWLLNTKEEMARVDKLTPKIFDRITNRRPWVFIGYSGEDPVFEHVLGLGRFDNGLYWVGYKDELPSSKVCNELLRAENKNACIIKGYDADRFMLELSIKLELEQPSVFSKPFSGAKIVLNNIVDIDDEKHFQPVKERLSISHRWIDEAIANYELGEIPEKMASQRQLEIDRLMNEITDQALSESFDEAIVASLTKRAKDLKSQDAIRNVAWLYIAEGDTLADVARNKNGDEAERLYTRAFERYDQAMRIMPSMEEAPNNWGVALSFLANTKTGIEAINIYQLAIEKYRNATKINPKFALAIENIGHALNAIADNSIGTDVSSFYAEAIDHFSEAVALNPGRHLLFSGYGRALLGLALTKKDEEADRLFNQSFEKFRQAILLQQNPSETYYDLGNALLMKAGTKPKSEADILLFDAIDQYHKAIAYGFESPEVYFNWSMALIELAKTKPKEIAITHYLEAKDRAQRAIELGGNSYNLACVHALLNEKVEAIELLKLCLERKEITVTHVRTDKDWDNLREDSDFNELLKRFV